MANKRITFFKKRLTNLIKKVSKPFSKSEKTATAKTKPKSSLSKGQLTKGSEKKVLMFGWELPPFNSGGLGVACFEIAQSIAKKNTDVTFVLPKKQDIKVPFGLDFVDYKQATRGEDKCFSVKGVNSPLFPYLTAEEYAKVIKERGISGSDIYGDDLIAEVKRYGLAAGDLAKKRKFDVIHAHDWLSYPAGIRAKEVSGRPLIAHVHALEYDRSHETSLNTAICAIEKEGFKKADKVIAISQYVKDRVVRFYDIDPKKIEIVHNGINYAPSKPKKKYNLASLKRKGTKIVLFVGRLTYQKGVEYLVSAAHKALQYDKNILFVIVGNGDSMHRIVDQAAYLGISDKVLFPGFLRGNELEKIYRAADVFVMPSVSEPFGLVALEALTNSVPVILSKQSGAAEVVRNSLTVDFWDTDELANKIIAVTRSGILRRALSIYGFKDAKRCTWEAAAEKCIKIYQGLSTA